MRLSKSPCTHIKTKWLYVCMVRPSQTHIQRLLTSISRVIGAVRMVSTERCSAMVISYMYRFVQSLIRKFKIISF